MKLLILKGLPEAHLYSQSANALQAAFQEIGQTCEVWERPFYGAEGAALEAFIRELGEALILDSYEAVVSFGGLLGDIAFADGGSVYDLIGVRFLGWMFDHPIFSTGMLSKALQRRCSVYSNARHLDFAQAVGVAGPGAALLPGPGGPIRPARPHSERQWPIVVAAGFRGSPATRPWSHWPDSPERRLADDITDQLLDSREASLVDAVQGAAKSRGLDPDAIWEWDPEYKLAREALIYVRDRDRFLAIQALAEAGLPLLICGSGWREALGEAANVTFRESVPFGEVQALYADARICLNLNAGNGACERAVQSAAVGTAVLSDYSSVLEDLLGADAGVGFFRRGDPESLVATASRLLEGDRSEAFGATAQARVRAQGLWRHRAEAAVSLLQAPLAPQAL